MDHEFKQLSHPILKGQRLEMVRKMTFLSREGFCVKHGFKTETFRSWKNGLHNGLPLKRAKELSKIFLREGILVSAEWLMQGIGGKPEFIDLDKIIEIARETLRNDLMASENFECLDEAEKIQQELRFFELGQTRETISLIVQDDGMSPFYNEGDMVAGVKYYGKEIEDLKCQDCIITMLGNENPVLRRIKLGKDKYHYDLVCINTNTTLEKPLLKNKQLISAAPIVWFRKSLPNQNNTDYHNEIYQKMV